MTRLFLLAIAATSLFAVSASAQSHPVAPPPAKALRYKVSLGGMNAGTFSQMAIPTHVISIAGNDVRVTTRASEVDGRPIKLTGGTVSAFTQRVLTPKLGEQMTVEIDVITVGVAPGKRCTITLTHAYLKGINGAQLLIRPSSLPSKRCTGDKPPVEAPAAPAAP